MNRTFRTAVAALALWGCWAVSAPAQDVPRFRGAERQGDCEVRLGLGATPGTLIRLETSSNLLHWQSLRTLRSAGNDEVSVSSAASLGAARFFRLVEVTDPQALTGDHLATEDGEVLIHPVNHASFVLRWKGVTVYNDPVGGAAPYAGLPPADLILVSHQHGDHFHAATLQAVGTTNTVIVAPAAVYGMLSAALRARTVPLANGESTHLLGMTLDAVPAYNGNHPRGAGNGYVLTVGGRRLYVSGDTGAIPETRALTGIDAAFLCMNVPFTMTVSEAASVARDFRPRILYPYHFRNQNGTFADLAALQREVRACEGVEVRIRDWY